MAQAATPVTVEDMIGFATVGDPGTVGFNDVKRFEESNSRDGHWTAVVVRRGNVQTLTNDAQLIVYDRHRRLDKPRPSFSVQFSSRVNTQPIALVRWLPDSKTILFVGTSGSAPAQVFRVNVLTGEQTQLTHATSAVLWYALNDQASHLVAASTSEALKVEGNGPRLITAMSLKEAQEGIEPWATSLTVCELHTAQCRQPFDSGKLDENYSALRGDPVHSLSPDGRFCLQNFVPHRWPSWWEEYSIGQGMSGWLKRGNSRGVTVPVLVDLKTGVRTPLTAAPWRRSPAPKVIWIDGGRYLLVINAFEPLAAVESHERVLRVSHAMVTIIDPNTLTTERVAVLDRKIVDVVDASWNQTNQMLVIDVRSADKSISRLHYRRTGKNWVASQAKLPAVAKVTQARVQLVVEESLNEPPRLVALGQHSRKRQVLLDPNPWLQQRKLGRVEAISWKSADGKTWRGGLYYPVDFAADRRYPVVLQTHGFEEDRFSLWGRSRNYAAQPLAGQGIMVLQIADNYSEVVATPAELTTTRLGYEAAVDHLDTLGLIDRNRVCLHAWSRTGTHVGYTLTHSKQTFACAIFYDAQASGWWTYMAAGNPRHQNEMESVFGTAPFGEGLRPWMEVSPAFNLQRIVAPVLIWDAYSIAGSWDWYAGLRRLSRPVEYWYAPESEHNIYPIDQRLLYGQLIVDWYRYWLKGEEDSAEEKRDQYFRWRAMKSPPR